VRENFAGEEFYPTLWRLAVPVAMQQLVLTALNAVDVLMVGQLGDAPVAAVGLANQVYFLLTLYLFGVGSGASIFSAQFWGRHDLDNVRHMLGIALLLGIAGGAVFTLAAIFAPAFILRLYTEDPAVILLGSSYLRLVSLSYIPLAITTMYGMVLRSTRQVRIPMVVSVAALSLKTVLAFCLIFGIAGLPALGIMGAAIATVIARALECAAILTWTYLARLPAAARLREILILKRSLLTEFARTAFPVILGEILWSFGITIYSAVYARIGTQSITAINITTTIESVAIVPFVGIATACAIMLGNYIGAGQTARAGEYARRFLRITIVGALFVGGLVFVAAGPIVSLYQISPGAQVDARNVLIVVAAGLWVKSSNLMMIVGILRSGGDTRFALFADTAPLWLIGVPMALLGAFVLGLPVYWVALMVLADEITKFCLCLWRVLSGLWIHDVVRAI
jgi:putative MATE family efflux protein